MPLGACQALTVTDSKRLVRTELDVLWVRAPVSMWAWLGGPCWSCLGKEEKLNGTEAPWSCRQEQAEPAFCPSSGGLAARELEG